MITCIKCDLNKPESAFYKHDKHGKYLRHECKVCWRVRTDSWAKNNREKYLSNWKEWRKTHKKEISGYIKKYVVKIGGVKEYSKMKDKGRTNLRNQTLNILLPLQDNKCAICKKIFASNIVAYVDHDYTNMKIRGLLCPKCNVGVSFFEEWKDFSKKAKKYLENYPAKNIELPFYWYKNKSLK